MAHSLLSTLTLALLVRTTAAICPFDMVRCIDWTAFSSVRACNERLKAASCRTGVETQMQELMAQCSRSELDCDDVQEELTGRRLSDRSSDPEQEEFEKKVTQWETLRDRVGSEMLDCEGPRRTCEERVNEEIKNTLGRDVSEAEVKEVLKRAAEAKAGAAVLECVEKASSEEDKESCFAGPDAKRIGAQVSGKDEEDIDEDFLRRAARTSGEDALINEVSTCLNSANTEEEKKACRTSDENRQRVADFMGEDKANVKDSTVHQRLRNAAGRQVLATHEACEGEKGICNDKSKSQFAAATGRPESEVSQLDIERVKTEALKHKIADLEEECLQGEASDCAQCFELARTEMQEADLEGARPDDEELKEMLRDAALTKVIEEQGRCGCTQQCRESAKAKYSRVSGMCDKVITDTELLEVEEMAKLERVNQAAIACLDAKEDAGDCENVYEMYRAPCGEEKPSDDVVARTEEWTVSERAARGAAADTLELCVEVGGEELESCRAAARGVAELLVGEGKSAQRAQRKAKVEVAGEQRCNCEKRGESGCETQMESSMQLLEMEGEAMHVYDLYRVELFAGCGEGCRESVEDASWASCVDENKRATFQKVGAERSAYETWGACSQTGAEDEKCDALAREAYARVSGSSDSFDAERTQKLGLASAKGEEPILVRHNRVAVTCTTDESACSEDTQAKLAAEVEKVAADNGKDLAATARRCSLGDGTAKYSFLVNLEKGATREDVEGLAAKFPPVLRQVDLSQRRLSQGRRLAAVTGAFATQDMEECAPSDSACLGVTLGSVDLAAQTTLAVASPFIGLAALVGVAS